MSPSTRFHLPLMPSRGSGRRAAGSTALLIAAALALTACGSKDGDSASSSSSDDTFVAVDLTGDTTPPDPDVNYDGNLLNVTENTYQGLVAYSDGVEAPTIVPELATAWTVSADGLTYTFTLRDGVTFHDGTPFTSAAVKASIDRRKSVDGGSAYMVADVVSVGTPDDLTAVITIKARNDAFLDYLASPFGVKMISPTVLDQQGGDDFAQTYLTTHDAGTGPYELTAATAGEEYTLDAYDGYWGDWPKLTSVDLKFEDNASSAQLQLERGEIDAILGNVTKTAFGSYAGSDEVTASTFANFTTQMVYVNPESAIFSTADSRSTLFRSIDTAGIIDAAMGSLEKTTGELFPAGMVDASVDTQGISYDQTALSGLATATAGKTLKVAYPASSAENKAVAEELVSRLNTAGVKAEADSYGAGTIYSLADKGADGPDLAVFSVFPDAGHVDAWASIIYTPDGGLDIFGAQVDGLSDLLDQARTSSADDAYAGVASAVIASKYWYSIGSLNSTLLTAPDITGTTQAQNVLEFDVLHFAALGRS